MGSNCTTLLVQRLVNFSLLEQEQRGHGRKQQCCTNDVVQFHPSLTVIIIPRLCNRSSRISKLMGWENVYLNFHH